MTTKPFKNLLVLNNPLILAPHLSFSDFKYKPEYFYWSIVIIFRKLLLVVFTLVFHTNATMQLSTILLVCFVAYTLQVKYNPTCAQMTSVRFSIRCRPDAGKIKGSILLALAY